MTDGNLEVGNGRTRVSISERDGFTVTSIFDRESGANWIKDPGQAYLWRVFGVGRDGEKKVITSSDCSAPSVTKSARQLILRFDMPESLQVRVRAKNLGPDLVSLDLKILDLGQLSLVERIDFPNLAGIQDPPSPSYLAFPFEQGILVHDPRSTIFRNQKTSFRLSGSYPGNYSMQFLAYGSSGGPGLYLACYDPDGYVKRFNMERGANDSPVFFIESHFRDPSSPGAIPYPAVVGTYQGTWLDAAAIYRRWALKQRWCSKGRLSEGSAPNWLQSTPAWIWNRGRAAEVIPPTVRLSKYLSRPVALDWYWWHDNPYDTMLPEYLPPRDGEKTFKEAIDYIHRNDMRCIVYINGRCCDIQSREFREDVAVLRESGETETELYCKFTGSRLAVMCPGMRYWRTKISDIVSDIVGYGMDGVYIDQIASASPRLCFRDSHKHPIGGGRVWADGNRSLLRNSRKKAKSRSQDAMICSEGCCEVYLDLLDAFLTLSPSYERMGMFKSYGDNWEPIPMFNSVYHELAITFGSYASLSEPPYDELWPPREVVVGNDIVKFADQFDLEIARCLIFGQKLMIANFHPDQLKQPRMSESLEFFRKACILHEYLEEYLTRGKYFGSLDMQVPSIRLKCLNKGIYTIPGKAEMVSRTVPAILTSIWKASDGSVAIVLANISHRSHTLDVGFFDADALKGASVIRIKPNGGDCKTDDLSDDGLLEIQAKDVVGVKYK